MGLGIRGKIAEQAQQRQANREAREADPNNPNIIDPNIDDVAFSYAPVSPAYRSLTDLNQDVFRYGLTKLDNSQYEDPTYLGFTIELDEKSALFTQVLPFLEKHSDIPDLVARKPVYKEFVTRIRQMFNSQESVVNPNDKTEFVKQHYINSISGLDMLTNKFINWREDKLTFQLHEDISLYSSYIAYLYNNLIYSYENGRALIPENLLKFNMYIKISEIRNLTSIAKLMSNNTIDNNVANALKNNTTSLIYKLYDCEYDFFKSKPFDDQISQAGIDGTTPPHSLLSFELYCKRVSRQIYTPLINNSLSMNDDKIDLGVIILSTTGSASTTGAPSDPSKTTTDENGNPVEQQTVTAVSPFKQEAFGNEDAKRPSSYKTYNKEIEKHPELSETNDIVGREQEIQVLQDYNKDVKDYYDKKYADERARSAGSQINIEPGSEEALMLQNAGVDITSMIDDPQKALGLLTDKADSLKAYAQKLGLEQVERVKQQLERKKNELIRTFINDVAQNVGLKKIIPDNVYEDKNFLADTLGQYGANIGNSIKDEVIDTLIDISGLNQIKKL